jgi:hypothetical protein
MKRKANSGSSRRPTSPRVPVTVPLPEGVVKRIDEERDQRDIPLSRNNWLFEAAIEKLRKSGESHGAK